MYATLEQYDHPHIALSHLLEHAAQVIDGLPERRNNAGQPLSMNEWLRSSPNAGWRRMLRRRGEPLYKKLLDAWEGSTQGGRRKLAKLEFKGAGMDIDIDIDSDSDSDSD